MRKNSNQLSFLGVDSDQDPQSLFYAEPETFTFELVDPNTAYLIDTDRLTQAEADSFNRDRRQIGSDYRWIKQR